MDPFCTGVIAFLKLNRRRKNLLKALREDPIKGAMEMDEAG